MGLFSFVGGLLGGGSAKKASRKAMEAQVAAAEKGMAEQRRQYDQTRADFEPFRLSGTTALGRLNDLVGTNGAEPQDEAIAALRASPFYQRLYGAGEEAVLANASATGGLRGGNTGASLYRLGEGTLMDTIDRQLASYGGLAGMGMGATESVANFGQQRANNVTGLLGQIGNAQATNHLTRGGINAGMWKSAGSFADQVAGSFIGAGGMPGGQSFNLSKFMGGF